MEIRKELNLKKPYFLQQDRAGHSNCGELILKKIKNLIVYLFTLLERVLLSGYLKSME